LRSGTLKQGEKTVKQQRKILVAIVAAIAPLAVAHANDLVITGQTGYFQQAAAMPKSPDMLTLNGGHVRRSPLGWEYITYDTPQGAQGPIREEENVQATQTRQAEENFWDNLYPIGGMDTP
jgi:hypothetical protein